MTLGEIVFSYRKAHDLSQREFAKICGLSNAYISMLENNKNTKTGLPVTPSLVSIKAISQAMHVPLDEVLSRLDNIRISLSNESFSDSSSLSPDELRLLSAYRNASEDVQKAAIAMLEAVTADVKKENHA